MPNIWTRFASIFQPREQKMNPMWQGLIGYNADHPNPVRMGKSYKSFVNEGYKQVDTLYKVVSYISRNGAAIPPILYTDETKQQRIDKHPLLDKLKRPNPEQSGVAYREAVLGFKLLAGNSFQYAIRAKGKAPDELWPLRPDRVELLATKKSGIIGYRYEFLDQPIDPADIGHTKYWNPLDDETPGMGMSPIEAAALNADMQRDGKKWNLALLQNSARPPGAWTTPTPLSPNDRNKLEQKLNEKFAGVRNAGKFPVLDGGLTWTSMGLAPAQMDFLDLLKYNGGSIANIYNIAPQLVGDTSASTYDNMEQAKQASYTEAIFPDLDDLYAMWQNWLVPMYPDLCDRQGNPTAYLYYDKESVEVIQKLIQAQKDAQADRANKMWLSGLMMQNEARVLAGLPETPEGKIYRIGAILVPADKMQEYAEQSLTTPAAPPPAQPEPLSGPDAQPQMPPQEQDKPANEDQEQSTEKEPQQAPPEKPADVQKEKSLPIQHMSVKALDLDTAEQKAAYAQSMESSRERWYDEAEQRLKAYFEQERKAVVRAINDAALPETAEVRAEAAVGSQEDKLKDVLLGIWTDVSADIGAQVAKELQAGTGEQKGAFRDFVNLFGEETLKYLLTLAGTKIKQISATTQAKIRLELTDGVAKGESIPKLAKRIDALYLDQIIPNRSSTIAITEVVASSNYGSQEAARQSGLTLKKVWLATHDGRTRPDHIAADGQEVDLDEPFTVGDSELMFPGDNSLGASADELVRCRCTQIYRRVKATDTSDTSEGGSDEKVSPRRPYREEYRNFMREVLV